MPFYEWSESMSVDVPLLDDDNKRLIGMINQLYERTQDGAGYDVLNEIIDNLIAHIEFHFAREEKVMEACGYPFAKAHRVEHVIFIEHIYSLRSRQLRRATPPIANELPEYLKNWLNHHIQILDMKCQYFVRNNPRADKVACAFGS